MFTGIVATTGRITHLQTLEKGLRLTVEAPELDLSDVAIGDSIAHGGVCLTVIEKDGQCYKIDVSRETLGCTVGLDAPGEVNLEKAMRLADRVGGHLVSGHVDGVGEVIKFDRIGESHELVIRAPQPYGPPWPGPPCLALVALPTTPPQKCAAPKTRRTKAGPALRRAPRRRSGIPALRCDAKQNNFIFNRLQAVT